jgi:hypothetical protein
MNPGPIPAPDAMPVPGPFWLFHVLLVFTFFLHLVFMNLTLGGTLLAAVSQLLSGGRTGDPRTVLACRLMGVNTFGISLTITTGVAPLLFVQVLYQQYFYTATILLGWIWFAFLGLLMAGYYAAYVYKFHGVPKKGSGGTAWLLFSALSFLLIAMIHVAVNLIHAQPAIWTRVADNPWIILGDPAYFPRLLHFVFASIAFSAVVLCWWSVRQARRGEDVDHNRAIAGFTWKWALWATVLQVADGFVLLMVLPSHVLKGIMTGGVTTLGPLTLAVLLGLGLLMLLSRVTDPVADPAKVTLALAVLTGTIAVMAVTRHQVRALYLAASRARFHIAAQTQLGPLVLFFVLLVAGLAAVAYMVARVLASRAEGREAA